MNWKKNQWYLHHTLGYLGLLFIVVCSCKETKKVKNNSRVAALPYYNEATFTPHWLTPNSKEVSAFHAIPDFKLINQLGDTISHKTFENKIYITDFFFTSCSGICPKMTTNMLKLQEEFKAEDDILLLSHSVTPKFDSVPVLKEYAATKGIIANKWHLVTGDRSEIYNLGRHHYFVEENLGLEKDDSDFLHTENFLLIDTNKNIRGIYNGLSNNAIRQLIIDARALQSEQ